MATRIRGARLVAVAQCGHMSTMEQPQAVGEALAAWLQGGPATA
jgi:pimeloyl-ACP methyl ester carboxylesterase